MRLPGKRSGPVELHLEIDAAQVIHLGGIYCRYSDNSIPAMPDGAMSRLTWSMVR